MCQVALANVNKLQPPYELWMTTEKIYVDASQPAILRHLGGTFACPTLGAAMIAWDELPDKGDATI
jgi:hypothetical protein